MAFALRWRRRKDLDDDEDDCRTQDGTVDMYGRPASKRKTGGWKGASFCLVQQMMSTSAYVGVTANLVTYMTVVMHQSNQAAAQIVSNWNGTSYITPLIVAFVADSYSGRFAGAVMSSVVNIMGFAMLTIAGSFHIFRPPQCATKDLHCEQPTLSQRAFLFAGLYITVVGCGGIAGTVVTMGADQFDEQDEAESRKRSSYFTSSLVAMLAGSFLATTFFIYVQDNVSAGLAWGLSTVVLNVGTVVFLSGRRVFRYQKTGGNPLIRIAQVAVAFVRNVNVRVVNPEDLYEGARGEDSESAAFKASRRVQRSSKFRFLDKAALLTDEGKPKAGQILPNPWRVCTLTQVEEVKFLLSVFPIFMTCILFSTCWSQVLTLFIEQSYSLDCKLGSFTIPAASIDVFESLSVFFWALVYDRLLVPFLRKRTGNPRGMTDLQRIGCGLFLSIVAMVLAAAIDTKRIHTARVHGLLDRPGTPIPMSVFHLVPQYFVIGAAEVFTYVGLTEFFYDQAPDALRCLAISFEYLTIALGFFVSTLLLTIVGLITKRDGGAGWIANNLNRARLDLFYWLLAVLSTINLLLFLFFATHFEYKVVVKENFKEPLGSAFTLEKELSTGKVLSADLTLAESKVGTNPV